jgi:hypothetical protein
LSFFPPPQQHGKAALGGKAVAAMLALGDAVDALRDGTLGGLGIAARNAVGSFPGMPPI